MLKTNPSKLRRYSTAALSVAVAVFLSSLLLPLIQPNIVSLFLAAVAFSAWYGGLEPAILATILSILAIGFFFIWPFYALPVGWDTLVRIIIFGFVALIISALSAELRTAKQRSEESLAKLKISEQQYRHIVETANEAIWLVDAQWKTTYVNEQMAQMFGYSSAEMMGRPLFDFMDEEARQEVQPHLQRRQQGIKENYDFRFRRQDGSDLWAIVSSNPIFDDQGKFAGRLAMLVDVTERKQAEQALQASEKRYRAFVEQSSEGIWRFELQQPIAITTPIDQQIQLFYEFAYLAECNNVMAQMYGYPSETEILGLKLADFNPPSHPNNIEMLRQFIRANYRLSEIETQELDRAGNIKYFLNNFVGIVENGYLVRAWGMQRDITDRKQLEATLNESESRFRDMADHAPVLIWMSGIDKLCDYFNQGWLSFTGRTLAEEFGNGWLEGVHPEDLQFCLDTYSTAFDRRENFQMEYRLRRYDGVYRWILDSGTPRFTGDGRFLGYIGSCIDITDRKAAEAALIENEEQIRLITDSVPTLISYVDNQERYIFNNKTYEEWFGIERNKIQGKELKEVMSEAVYAIVEPYVKLALSGQKVSYDSSFEYSEGIQRYVQVSYIPHISESGKVKGFIALVNDMSERQRTQAEILNLNQQLQRRIAELETLLDVIPVGIGIAADRDCRLLKVNSYLANILKMPAEEMNHSLISLTEERNQEYSIYKIDKDQPFEDLPMQKSAALGVEILEEELDVVRKDGSRRKLLASTAPLFDAAGQSNGCVAAFVDITDRKYAAERQRFLAEASAALVSSLDYATTLSRVAQLAVPHIADWCTVHIVKEDGQVEQLAVAHVDPKKVEWAHELQRLYPFNPEELRGLAQVFRTGQAELYPEISDEMLVLGARDPHHLEILREVGFSSVMLVPMTIRGRCLGAISLIAAESGRRYSETDLALAEELAHRAGIAVENARLYTIAQHERSEAEKANRIKDEFLATLSHELRTPLTSILGWAKLLRTRSFDPETIGRALETIERNAKSQSQLIEDLLDVSRIITGKLRLNVRTVDLRVIIGAALEAVRPAAEAKSIQLQPILDSTLQPVSGDPERLQQAVWNLLSNAIKFTPKQGRVQIRLEQVNSSVEITVSDTGTGITPEFLPYVFERFRQADSSSTRTHGGLGLGLAIVRHIVELHGGTVAAASPGLDQGATFTIKLPVRIIHLVQPSAKNVTEAPQPPASEEEGSVLDGLRLLVVEDDPDGRELITTILEEYGAQVSAAASVVEALAVFETLKPDVLISDIEMPGEDGYRLIRQIRVIEASNGQKVPAIALTAYARAEDRRRVLLSGFQMHVAKPVEPAELVAVVANLVGRTN